MRAAEQAEYIVQCIRDAGSMYEDDARAFLAEHDAQVRADALAEGAALLTAATDRAATTEPQTGEATFFQPGHSYTSGTCKFRCDAITPSPGTGERRALGWRFAPVYDVHHWHAFALDPDDWKHGDWTDTTEVTS
ncbi:hypothetical protein [Streptomyces sp. FL07-04A]|uniref:hypothetical protein n=1 Tax=Streptomyces sp. FL07-04A TaxID=3028658 RepID=UPI0029AFC133|nr:hypothetical protein [Streptomyces sp. FL07-04A]MDX3575920.1 hypothetical protein [Streptomyces sp. FL07-04A]